MESSSDKKIKLNTSLPLFTKLFSWSSPEREWSEKTRAWYVVYSAFFVFIIAIAAILGQYLLIMAIIAFVFLWFTQAAIPPQVSEHIITTIGIKSFDKLFKWKDIKQFWFAIKNETKFLIIDVIEDPEKPNTYKRISIIVNKNDDKEIFFILLNYIDYGDRKEVGYNFLTQIIHGQIIDISYYLPEEIYTQEQYLEAEKLLPVGKKKASFKKPDLKSKKAKQHKS